MTEPARPMPPRPASGGSWQFDEAAWAYVPAASAAETPVEPSVQTPVEPPVLPAPKTAKDPRK